MSTIIQFLYEFFFSKEDPKDNSHLIITPENDPHFF